MRVKRQSPPHKQYWFRMLMATVLVSLAVGLGSIVGVMARTFNPPQTYKRVFNQETNQYELVAVKNAIDPWSIISSISQGPLDRKVNILLLGSDYNYVRGKRVDDQQSGTRSRTDTIMLASLDPNTQKVSILSIPRDTRALLTGYHYDKINAAMTYGGVDLVKSTVSDLTGVPIDYYMALKVDGLVNTVDILGGIRMYVEKDMYYMDETAHLGINIHKGWKEAMNGEQAHQYIRFRKDELGDIGRVQRQQKFMRAVLDKLLQPTSWLKLPDLLAHLNQNIETDIPSEVIGQIARFGAGLNKDALQMVMLPGTFANYGGVSFWEMNNYQARQVITELFPESSLAAEMPESDPNSLENPLSQYRVAVWNATGDLRTGREVLRRLREAGWNVWSVRKAPHDTPVTRLIAQNGKSSVLKELQHSLGFNAETVTASVGELGSDFTVLIGPDLVKYYAQTLSDEDWQRAQKQPLPTAPVYQQPRRQQRLQATTPQAPLQTRSATVRTPASLAPRSTQAPPKTQVDIQPQLPQSAQQQTQVQAPIPIPDEVEIQHPDPLYN